MNLCEYYMNMLPIYLASRTFSPFGVHFSSKQLTDKKLFLWETEGTEHIVSVGEGRSSIVESTARYGSGMNNFSYIFGLFTKQYDMQVRLL